MLSKESPLRRPAEIDFLTAWRSALKAEPAMHRRPLAAEPSSQTFAVFQRLERRNRTNTTLLIVAALGLIILAWFLAPKNAGAEVIDRIAAVVNQEIITEIELNRALSAKDRGATPSKTSPSNRSEVLDRLIDEKLFSQLLEKSKIEVKDDDLARAIANVLHENRMTIDQLKAEIAAKGMSYEEYKKQIEKEIRRIKFVNQVIGPQVKITDQDLRDYYQGHQERFRGGSSAHIAEIVFPLEGLTTEAEYKAVGDTARDVIAKARKGANIDALIKQYSAGPRAAQGGDLGMINLKDLPPEIASTVRLLKVGDVSAPVIAGNALVIIKLIALPEIAAGDFDRLRDQIYSALYDQKIEETLESYLQKERQKAFVEIR